MLGVSSATALGVAAGVAVIGLFVALRPAKVCPKCARVQPRIQLPASLSQAMLFWRPCVQCGARLAPSGRLLAD